MIEVIPMLDGQFTITTNGELYLDSSFNEVSIAHAKRFKTKEDAELFKTKYIRKLILTQ